MSFCAWLPQKVEDSERDTMQECLVTQWPRTLQGDINYPEEFEHYKVAGNNLATCIHYSPLCYTLHTSILSTGTTHLHLCYQHVHITHLYVINRHTLLTTHLYVINKHTLLTTHIIVINKYTLLTSVLSTGIDVSVLIW